MRSGRVSRELSDNDNNNHNDHDSNNDHQDKQLIMNASREIRLPADLCAAAEQKFGGTFRTVDDLLTFLLQELLRNDTLDMDRADQAVVEERLRDLGYI